MPGALYFYTAEVDVYLPAATVAVVTPGHGTSPHGVLPISVTAASGTIYASDIGYRTLSSDAGGVVPYPPVLEAAFAIDRRINLEPSAPAAGAAWGAISLDNTGGRFNAIAATQNSDGRGVRIATGAKTWDTARGLWLDLTKAINQPLFYGIAEPWTLGVDTLDIPLRDATYWLEKPVQSNLYDGSGTYGGSADMKGKPKPKTRGGTNSWPVCNVAPVLIDPANLIYQYSDGPGTVVRLYEGADLNITFQADTANLYVGATTAGKYRTDNSRGLFQLGSLAQRQITADVTGQFPTAGVVTTGAAIARYLLSEDGALPGGYLDTATFAAIDASYPYTSGIYIAPDDGIDAINAAAFMVAGWGGKIFPKRDGTLSIFAPRTPSGASGYYARLGTNTVVACTPASLPPILYPPPYRIRVGFQRAWAVQTSGLSPIAPASRQSFVAQAWRSDSASSAAIIAAYRRPNDPPIIESALLASTDISTIATDLMNTWGPRRRLYDVTVPVITGINLEIGNTVLLTYPLDDLRNGAPALIVGEQFRSQDSTITFQVLV